MVMVKLAYEPKKKKWRELEMDSLEYKKKKINDYLVVTLNKLLWGKVQNIMKIRKKGWDAVILIDGMRRSGKSTLGKTIAYVLDPEMTIKNIIGGLKDSFRALEEVKDDSVLMFDESSLNFASKDALKKAQGQLLKIIDVIGQKHLTLIFILPSVFELNKSIAISHSLFLLHVYPSKNLERGRFCYFGQKKKRLLYEIGKKNFGSYKKPKSAFTGLFIDFELPFEDEYLELKKQSLRETLGLDKDKPTLISEDEWKQFFVILFVKNSPEMLQKDIAKGFGISRKTVWEYMKPFQDKTEENKKNLVKEKICNSSLVSHML